MKKLLLPFFTLAFCFFTQVSFAQKFYMKVGRLTEDASGRGTFEDYAEITSRQFSITAPPVQNSGQISFQDVVVTKFSDVSSNRLLNVMTKGSRIEEVEIVSTTRTDQAEQVIINKIQLKNVVFVSYANSAAEGCATGCEGIAESYKFSYDAIKITSYSQSEEGRVTEDPQPFMYNRRTGTNTY